MAKTYFVIRCALHNYWFYGRIITGEEKEKKVYAETIMLKEY